MTVPVGACRHCPHLHHPRRAHCPSCGGAVEERSHDGHGTVVSWTRVERPPSGFEAPQRVLLVQLDATTDRPLGPLALAMTDVDALMAAGTRVRLAPDPDARLWATAEH